MISLASVLTVMVLLGCTTFGPIKAVHPDVDNPKFPTLVDSLQPTLEWQSQVPAEGYDLVVYEVIRTDSLLEGTETHGRAPDLLPRAAAGHAPSVGRAIKTVDRVLLVRSQS